MLVLIGCCKPAIGTFRNHLGIAISPKGCVLVPHEASFSLIAGEQFSGQPGVK